MDDPHFLTTEEAARLLNVHQNTIVRWIKSGRLPSSKIGRDYRIPREAIDNRVNRATAGTRIIAVANQKGGVAKTTINPPKFTVNLRYSRPNYGKMEGATGPGTKQKRACDHPQAPISQSLVCSLTMERCYRQ